MANRKVLMGLTGFLVVLVAVLGLGMDVMSMSSASADDDKGRSDLILIDVIVRQQALDMPAAEFLHDKHTKAMEEKGKDCSACHKTRKAQDGSEVLAFAFMRTEELDAVALKELYHKKCISCHAEEAKAGAKPYGPQAGECRKCHVENPEYADTRQPVSMDNSLHYRHWGSEVIPHDKGQDTNCGNCHHELDKASGKLVYIKFQEESCSYCHTGNPTGDVKMDTVTAFHAQCVNCHVSLKKAKIEKYGPSKCADCHSAEGQAATGENLAIMIKKIGGTLPRLPRKQPDASLMLPPAPKDQQEADRVKRQERLMPVAFNHLAHEQANDSCADCHHKSVKACSECHTEQGIEVGGFITLEQAMHQAGSKKSCVGCHAEKQKQPECAACHASVPKKAVPSRTSCETCHLTVTPPATQPAAQPESADAQEAPVAPKALLMPPLPTDKEARQALAKELVEQRSHKQLLVDVKDIPETVTIGALANEYKPSEMPHRKIVLKIMDNMKDDSLASVFHSTDVTACQGCHHNSPASKTPPSCASCHGKPFSEESPGRPGLKAAYHSQCMDCHKRMGLEKPGATDCVACHAKKDSRIAQGE